ncbi:MAG TPA: PAS domain S-box protein, partial [Methanoregula sp.]|nr:PAS domain S-box protein [Methanoregula sp.]
MYRVLYVDDEPGLLEIGKLFLEQGGQFVVDLTASAPEALAQLDVQPYDAVLSDYQMPVMDGISFLKQVRSRDQGLPFILFTGRGREEVIIDAINNGADFYLQKGGDPLAQFTELAHKLRLAIERRQALGALRDSEQRLADIINFLPDATFAIDTGGRVIAWNRAIEEMTGVGASSVLGKGDHDYALAFYGTRRPHLIDLISESEETIRGGDYAILKREGNVLVAETAAEMRGEHKVFLCKASPLYNKDGNIAGAIESIRDITAQKATEATLARNRDYLDSIFSSVTTGILVIDAESHTVVDVNTAAAAMIGAGKEEVLGKACDRFISPAGEGRRPVTGPGRQADNPERELVTASGRHVPIVKYVTRVVFDGRERLLYTFNDNTERKRAEDELRAAYEQITASEEELRQRY